jgi:metal-responsive CopG/Arc/MetJ family transcriptional regulator
MDNYQNILTESITFKIDQDLIRKIDELRRGTERNRSQQIRLMLKKYLELKET